VVAGAVAGLGGLVASNLLTDLLNGRATPVEVVAETIIAITPGPVAEPLIHLVGTNDKPILVATTTVAIVVLGGLAGFLTARRRVYGTLVFAGMAVVALAAATTRPDFTPYDLLPLALGMVVWTVLLEWLTGLAARGPAGPTQAATVGPGTSRRTFLATAGAVTVAALATGAAGRLVGSGRRAVETTRSLLRLPVTRGTVPAGAQVAEAGTPWRVPNADFYRIDTAIVVPVVDPNDWELRIHGMVDREVRISYRQLVERRITEDWVTICCVSNEVGGDLIGNAWWSGVLVADLLAEAGVRPEADAVKQTSKDGWTCGTPLKALTDGRNAMLAVAMNGEPLPIEHGFPVRMIVPGLYGYVSATKWVVDLEVTRFDRFAAYWTDRGWSERGPVKTESRIEVPRSGADVKAGRLGVGGHAWAQHTGIAKVEYRVDLGPWRTAKLGRVPGDDTWVQWAGSVDVRSGKHTIAVRATDRSGYTQTSARADVVPNGATGWHSVDVSVG
jgi:DMSO/TMAO reductase YedYZ molybdopterin-dependent catalytic subunit